MDLVRANEHHIINKSFGTKEFGQLLETALKRQSEEKQKTSFAPSGLSYNGTCPRYWYYAFNGAVFSYDDDPTGITNMNSGTDAGKRLADLLDKAGILEAAEVEVRHEDPPIGGFIDALVRWKNEIVPVEIKTTKTETWLRRATTNTVPGYQLLQLLIYMKTKGFTKGFMLTEDKNTHQLFIYPVIMNEEREQLIEYVFDWMRKVKDNADNGELPTRPYTKSSFQCKGCPVKDKCWEGWTRGKVNGTDPNPGTVTLPILEIPK